MRERLIYSSTRGHCARSSEFVIMSIDHSVTKERPILFSGPMIKAILGDRKTQTRRIYKLPKDYTWSDFEQGLIVWDGNSCQYGIDELICPYGRIGDRLWVRETWSTHACFDEIKPSELKARSIHYWADGEAATGKKRPSIFMPRNFSRILLEITNVRVERLMSISKDDAIAEGCSGGHGSIPNYGYSAQPQEHYFWLWDQINGEGSYKVNPWVWVVEFKQVKS